MRAIVTGATLALTATTAGAIDYKPAPMAVCIDQAAAALKRLTTKGVKASRIDNVPIGTQIRARQLSRFPDGAPYFNEMYAFRFTITPTTTRLTGASRPTCAAPVSGCYRRNIPGRGLQTKSIIAGAMLALANAVRGQKTSSSTMLIN
jgi:hypothetical protein